ncbi:MAG: cyclin family protein [Promethearchaeota archaeon]|jgi:transcription initiation factor TFIIIB Brf1 subunit/transcription initiation factor TFIIB
MSNELYQKALKAYKTTSEIKQNIQKDVCKHVDTVNINSVNTCMDCGEEVSRCILHEQEWRYYGSADTNKSSDPTRVQARKSEEKSIYKDVETLGFSQKVIAKANQIYLETSKGKQIFRGNSRKAVIFACIFFAFKLLNIPQNHEQLIDLFGLTKRHGLKGIKVVNSNAPRESEIHNAKITPVALVKDLMCKFKASNDQIVKVCNLYSQIENRSSKLKRCRLQSCSAGLVYYWIKSENIDISLADFAVTATLSQLTITRMAKEIANVLGTPDVI